MDNHEHNQSIHTSTSLGRYLKCPRLYKHHHVDLLNPYSNEVGHEDVPNMKIGYAIHLILERIYHGHSYEDIIDGYKDFIPTKSENHVTSIIRAMIGAKVELGLDFSNFVEKEKELTVNLDVDGKIVWAGKLDGIYHHKPNVANNDGTLNPLSHMNGLWVVDHKCVGTRRWPKDDEAYKNNIQQIMYCIMARHHGYNVKGYIIDLWRIPGLKKYDDESWEEYTIKVKDDIIKTQLKQSNQTDNKYISVPYFGKQVYPVSDELIEKIFFNVQKWATLCSLDREYNQNFYACKDYYGNRCEFYSICHEGLDISSIPKTDKNHVELSTV